MKENKELSLDAHLERFIRRVIREELARLKKEKPRSFREKIVKKAKERNNE